jgi:hypothetical protein
MTDRRTMRSTRPCSRSLARGCSLRRSALMTGPAGAAKVGTIQSDGGCHDQGVEEGIRGGIPSP